MLIKILVIIIFRNLYLYKFLSLLFSLTYTYINSWVLQFYSHLDPVWSLLIIGTCCIWIELPVQRRLCQIFMNVSGYPTSTSILRVDGSSTDTPVLGCNNMSLKPFLRHPTPGASKNVKFRLSQNSTKFDVVARFCETILTM